MFKEIKAHFNSIDATFETELSHNLQCAVLRGSTYPWLRTPKGVLAMGYHYFATLWHRHPKRGFV